MTTEQLQEIDDLLSHFEDFTHGELGDRITRARGFISPPPPLTLQECKDKVAIDLGYHGVSSPWEALFDDNNCDIDLTNEIVDKVAELYAQTNSSRWVAVENEKKAKFFAQYLGCQVEGDDQASEEYKIELHDLDADSLSFWSNESGKLLLKPLSSITDEDAIEVAKIGRLSYSDTNENEFYDLEGFRAEIDNIICSNMHCLSMCDFLRSRGYALPYLDMSVDQLVEKGWVKLKEQEGLRG